MTLIAPRRAGRAATTAVLVGVGGAIAVAALVGDQPGLAVALAVFYAVAGTVAYLWSGGRGDAAALMRLDGDERQKAVDVRATALAGLAMGGFAVAGVIVDLARGGTGMPWAAICAVGGAAYVLALLVLRRRS